jgi:hypothetical protein
MTRLRVCRNFLIFDFVTTVDEESQARFHCFMASFFHPGFLTTPAHALGPAGPFPNAPLSDGLERRWLHYAFVSRDGEHSLVANLAWLGPDDCARSEPPHFTGVLLLHRNGQPWQSSQFNTETSTDLWTAFRPDGAAPMLELHAVSGEPAISLNLQRTSRPCSSQCAFFAKSQHLRWQSETGVLASGGWRLHGVETGVDAIGYHERVRGRWRWPDLDEWVFGFANELDGEPGKPPRYAGVFTFIKPRQPREATTGSFMFWRDGVMRRHFPRRRVSFAVRGALDPDRVDMVPPLAHLLGVRPAAPVPRRLVVSARMADDWAILDFESEYCARIVIPNEIGLLPFSVHEVVGACRLSGAIGGERFDIETRGIVEFAGGAAFD